MDIYGRPTVVKAQANRTANIVSRKKNRTRVFLKFRSELREMDSRLVKN